MRTIAHLSDLHFGRVNDRVLASLLDDLETCNPDLIAVSGDLTQRASRKQFEDAKAFLISLAWPMVVVPGNHDVPLLNPVGRFAKPLGRYKHHFSGFPDPYYTDDKMMVVGISTARPIFWRTGSLPPSVKRTSQGLFYDAGPDTMKIVVAHHSFMPPQKRRIPLAFDMAGRMAHLLRNEKPDILLAGHFHKSFHCLAGPDSETGKILVIHAGTAVSNRLRKEQNAFNLVHVEKNRVTVDVRAFNNDIFNSIAINSFVRRGGVWNPE
ncbi:metallophosphoesterase family protein [Desulfovibrio inopinatus]|uniref:metallophosphoesterase family protein n=1 Tax=Desulfovibrio inopinatus TaxID=102109 RepID=UPI00040DD7B5|nr:metallophosphoesterase [Desulfovibrio inopinatus]